MQMNVTMILTGDPIQFQTDLGAMKQLIAQAGLPPATALIVLRDALYEIPGVPEEASSESRKMPSRTENLNPSTTTPKSSFLQSSDEKADLPVHIIDIPYFRAEPVMDLLRPLLTNSELVLLSPGPEGDELAARLSVRMQGSGITCARGFSLPDAAVLSDTPAASLHDAEREIVAPGANELPSGGLLVQRSTCAGHLMSTSLLLQPPYFLSLDRSVRALASADSLEDFAEATALHDALCTDAPSDNTLEDGDVSNTLTSTFQQADGASPAPWRDPLGQSDLQVTREQRDNGLTGARRILATGRGIGSARNVQPLYDAAEALDAALGASRPVVMSAWLPMEHQLGVSGSMVSPELLIALGVSGSPAFYAGIEGARSIVAVNTDPNAPIMRKADLALVCDWKPFLQALQEHATWSSGSSRGSSSNSRPPR